MEAHGGRQQGLQAVLPNTVTDKDFEKINKHIPGSIDGIYLLDWTAIGRYEKVGVKEESGPKMAPKKVVTAEELAEARNPHTSRRRSAERWQKPSSTAPTR